MKNNKLIITASTVAVLVLLAVSVQAAETTKPETTAPTTTTTTTTTTTPTTQPTNGQNETGECWVWPHCIVIN